MPKSRNAKEAQEIGKIENELSPHQLLTIVCMVSGKTQQATAEELGIDPATISRWKQEPLFLAELNRRKADLYDAHHAELLTLAADARQVIRDALKGGPNRFRAAVYVLDELSAPTGETDPETIRLQRAKAARIRELDSVIAGL